MVKYHFEFTIETDKIKTGFPFFDAEQLLDNIVKNAEAHGCQLIGGFTIEQAAKDQTNVQKPDKPM